MTNPSTFGTRLKQLRQEHGLTQDTLAERIGCATQTIRKIEGGQRRPSYQIAAKLADELGIAAEERAHFVRFSRDEPRQAQTCFAPQTEPDIQPFVQPPANLPTSLTRLIGRERELARICELLIGGNARLLTVAGPGGSGKTRLAVEAAARLADHFADGIVFVNLVSVRDPALVITTIADAVGIGEEGGRSRLDRLKHALRTRSMLLVLDNFEQVVAAAEQVADLISWCSGLTALVTSREVLRIRGEHIFPLCPLYVPSNPQATADELLSQSAAVQLFVERASAANPFFTFTNQHAPAVAEICRRLDGLPLAIELAAARSAMLSPEALLARLGCRLKFLTSGPRDLPARQQTIRNTIAWSYDLLTPSEQALFRRLSVFIGGRTFAAIEAVGTAAGDLNVEIVDGIASLLDKSFLYQDAPVNNEPRFLMLETIREFGLEQLERNHEDRATRQAHANYYQQFVAQAEPHLWGEKQQLTLDQLEHEHDNVRAALAWHLTQNDDIAPALHMAGRLWRFWNIRGHWTEGQRWLEQALARQADAAPEHRWLALHGAGNLSLDLGEYVRAKAYYEESLAVTQQLKFERGIANSLLNLSLVASYQGDLQQAYAMQEQALAIHHSVENTVGVALVLHNLARVLEQQGDYERAEDLAEESLTLYRQLRDSRGIAWASHVLALLAHRRGAFERAKTALEECRAIYEQLGATTDLARVLNDLGELAGERAEHNQARALCGRSLQLAVELGDRRGQAAALQNLGRLAHRVGDTEHAMTLYHKSLSLRRDLGDKRGIASTLECLSQLASQRRYKAPTRLHWQAV